jgi:hypothetical protein
MKRPCSIYIYKLPIDFKYADPSSRRRGGPNSKHVSDLEMKKKKNGHAGRSNSKLLLCSALLSVLKLPITRKSNNTYVIVRP